MNRDGIYPDDDDNRIACLEAAGRVDELLEFADVVLMGQMVTGDDPADGVQMIVSGNGCNHLPRIGFPDPSLTIVAPL